MELFNLRHAQLRNVIERIFGVLKKRFPIMDSASYYDFPFQVDLVIACCVVHNYIRMRGCLVDRFVEEAIREEQENLINVQPAPIDDENGDVEALDSEEGKVWRDSIAYAMWNQYQTALARRR